MAILKYYKVDSEGKIKRLRRECPTAECGAGIFVRVVHLYPSTMLIMIIDGLPQGSSILRQVRIDLHLPAWIQASCGLEC